MDISPRGWGGLFAFVAFFGPLLWWVFERDRKQVAKFRQWAEQLYAETKITSSNPALAFDASCAEIVKDEEEVLAPNGKVIAYTLIRIARNPAGEYFWFRVDSGATPNLMSRHLSDSLAKVLLQGKYQSRQRKLLSYVRKRS